MIEHRKLLLTIQPAVGQYIKESDTNLATDVAIAHSKRFLRMMAQPFEQSTKSLWGIEEVRRLFSSFLPVSPADIIPRMQIMDKQRGLDPDRSADLNEDDIAALQAEADAAAAHDSMADDEAALLATEQNGEEDVSMQQYDPEDDAYQEIDDAALASMALPELPQMPLGFQGLPPPPPGMELPMQMDEGLPIPPLQYGEDELPRPPPDLW